MLTFESVSYQNFLSSGNVPITISLNTHASTLIVGRNGAGKSTLTEAISYALFGRPIRNINKPNLLNSVNKRDMLVELKFHIGETSYRIRRGMKPTVFEIYQDNTLIPAPASILDYQTLLETQILGMNHKSFLQIVVLGSASYVPFMRLTPAARREIIEDILDIEIFSAMHALAKDELGQLRARSEVLSTERKLLDEQVRMAESFQLQLSEQRDVQQHAIRDELARAYARGQELDANLADVTKAIQACEDVTSQLDAAQQKLTNYDTTKRAITGRVKKLDREREFYSSHDQCPTCAQSITTDFKEMRYDAIRQKQSDAELAITQCQGLIQKYTSKLAELTSQRDARSLLIQERTRYEAQRSVLKQRIRELQTQLDAASLPQTTTIVDIAQLQEQVSTVIVEQQTLARKKLVAESATALLKDTGIKARIIKHYLPIINKHINAYLTAMDFPIHFTLDENFEEHIQSRHRDDFSYESFSEGEKKRIDLALLLTWRAIARLKNSASCNILVLDEVFDSSLDTSGTEEFLKIIHTMEHTNIFVISHKTDSLIDKFSHVLHFERQRGFSALKT